MRRRAVRMPAPALVAALTFAMPALQGLVADAGVAAQSAAGAGARSSRTGAPAADPDGRATPAGGEPGTVAAGQAEIAVATGDFWIALGDTTLERLIRDALESNPDLHVVEAGVRSAGAERLRTALDLAPIVTAAGGYTRQRLSGSAFPGLGGSLPDQDVWEAGVAVSWELDAFGRIRHSVAGRGALLEAAEVAVEDARVRLAADVADAYFRLRGDQARLDVARQNAENQRRTLALTEDRLGAGRGNALDTERARAQLSSTLAEIPSLEAVIAASGHRISALTGRDAGAAPAGLEPGGATLGFAPLPPLPSGLALSDPVAAARRRPDVRGAERRLAAGAAFVGAAKARYLPRLSISGAAGYTASAFGDLGETGTPRYAIGPTVSWPLFDLGRVKADVDAARAREVAARADYEATVLRAREEALTALVAYETSRERLLHLEDAAAASARATDLARLRFEEGASDFLEVLDAERRLLEAQDRRESGRSAASAALVEVFRALGGAGPGAAGANDPDQEGD